VRLRGALVVAAVAAGIAAPAASADATAAATPSAAVQRAAAEVLVRFRSGVDSARADAATRAAGMVVVKRFTIVDGLVLARATGGPSERTSALASFGASPDVVYAVPNSVTRIDDARPEAAPNDPRYPEQWNLENTGQAGGTPDADVDAGAAWDQMTGSRDIVIELIDTGVQLNHPDLAANVWSNPAECAGAAGVDDDADGYVDDCHGIDTINGDGNPTDDYGHGTHTAGTIGAVGNNGVGIAGVNWAVSVLPCKSHDATGFATAASVIECLQYGAMLRARGVDIVATSNSYGGCTEACGFDPALYDAIDAHAVGGILFVASAGNDTSDNDTAPAYPASYFLPNVIAVASTTNHDARSSFSNVGAHTVHVGAPGSSVLSTYIGSAYATLSGTSMAAPHVSGLAALLAAQSPSRDWRAIRNLILAGGDPIASLAGKTVTGSRINAATSLSCTNRPVFAVLRPLRTVTGDVATTVAVLNIDCADPAGNLSVTIDPGGLRLPLRDRGIGADLAAGDGIYSAVWNPPAVTTSTGYRMRFSNGVTARVVVAPAP
jgi:subtilisin family serine protease